MTKLPAFVLDSSALLAFLLNEEGGENVEPHLSRCLLSAVNFAETATYLSRQSHSKEDIATLLEPWSWISSFSTKSRPCSQPIFTGKRPAMAFL